MTNRFAPLEPDDPQAIAGYQLRARLGAGGMGRVYLSFSLGGRALAIKVVRPEFAADVEFRRRFKLEVDAARRVRGLYTAEVVDADADAPVPWLATAYVPGPSLQQAVADHGPLPLPTVFRLLAGVAEGLAAVHACGLIHRDLKPGNVLLANDGPHVIDFGIAHAADATSITRTDLRVGTPSFMAPEQIRGHATTPALDVFSLGNLAVFAATGHTAFGEGDPIAMSYRIVNEPPDLGDCPPELRSIVERCLAKEPADRPSLTEIMTYAREQTSGDTMLYAGSWLPSAVATSLAGYALPIVPPYPPTQQLPPPTWPPPPPIQPPSGTRTAKIGGGIGVLVVVVIVVVMIVYWGSRPTSTNGTGSLADPPATTQQQARVTTNPTTDSPTTTDTTTTDPPTTSTTPPFDPNSLNDVTTDRTPQTVVALTPFEFTDATGRHFTRTAGGTESCVTRDQTSRVQNILTQDHCVSATTANYLSDDGVVLISVKVIGLADAQTAMNTYGALTGIHAGDMGFDCPQSGAGADICQPPQFDLYRQAVKFGWDVNDHRYLVEAAAVYTNLSQDQNAVAGLRVASHQAMISAGPQ